MTKNKALLILVEI